MATIIRADGHNGCHVEYEADYYGRVVLNLRAPRSGGYVRDACDGRQICERLAHTGRMLEWDGREPLVDLVRREYRRMRAAERRERQIR